MKRKRSEAIGRERSMHYPDKAVMEDESDESSSDRLVLDERLLNRSEHNALHVRT